MKRCLAAVFQMRVSEWLNSEPVNLSEIRTIVLKKSDIQSEKVWFIGGANYYIQGLNHLTRLQTHKGCTAPVGCVLEKSNIFAVRLEFHWPLSRVGIPGKGGT